MPTLADQIYAHIENQGRQSDIAGQLESAVLAVVDKAEQMRAESDNPLRVAGLAGHTIADEYLTVIARELGINPEETS